VSVERLWAAVEADHRAKVAAASDAYSRHRPRDELVKVRVTAPFRVAGREVTVGELVSVEKWLVSDLVVRGLVEKV
jgi:hypothetical protein